MKNRVLHIMAKLAFFFAILLVLTACSDDIELQPEEPNLDKETVEIYATLLCSDLAVEHVHSSESKSLSDTRLTLCEYCVVYCRDELEGGCDSDAATEAKKY